MIRYLGLGLVCLAALLYSGSYAAQRRRLLEELCAWEQLAAQLRREITAYARPVRTVCMQLRLPALEACGFLPAIRAGASVREAWAQAQPHSALTGDARTAVEGLLTSLGRQSRAQELEALGVLCDRLGQHVRTERTEGARQVRLVRTLTLAGALALALALV